MVKNAMKVIAFNLLLLMSLFIITEAVLRRLDPRPAVQEHRIRFKDNRSNLDYLIPVAPGLFPDPGTAPKDPRRFRTDAQGFIEPSRVHANPDRTLVFLGTSVTAGHYIREENRFPYLAGRLLEQSTHLKINSINNGVPANHSVFAANLLINKILPLHPDFVLFNSNMSDMTVLMLLGTYWNNHAAQSLITQHSGHTLNEIIKFLRYRAFPRLSDKLQALLPAFVPDEFADLRGHRAAFVPERIEKEYRRGLETLVAICRIHGIRPVLITEPGRLTARPEPDVRAKIAVLERDYGITYETVYRTHERFNDIIRQTASKENVLLIDLARLMAPDPKYFIDDFHMTDEGSKLAASLIADHLKPAILEREESRAP